LSVKVPTGFSNTFGVAFWLWRPPNLCI
jgi:hypothetical protein